LLQRLSLQLVDQIEPLGGIHLDRLLIAGLLDRGGAAGLIPAAAACGIVTEDGIRVREGIGHLPQPSAALRGGFFLAWTQCIF